jgi:mannosyltransferase
MQWMGSRVGKIAANPIFAPLILGLAATLISATGSSTPGPWRDEEATLVAGTRTWGQLYEMVRYQIDAVHALYYAFMHVWMSILPDDVFWMRLPSSLAVGAAVAGVVVLGRQLATPRLGVIAGIILLTFPRVLWSATEARSPAIQIALGVWLTVAFVLALTGGGWRRWVVWGLLSTISAYTFLFLVLLPISQVLALTLSPAGRQHFRSAAFTLGASVVALAPVTWLAYRQRAQVAWIGEYERNVLEAVTGSQWFGSGPLYGALAFVLIGAGAITLGTRTFNRGPIPRAILIPLLGLGVALPTLLLLVPELTDTPLYVGRYTVGSIGVASVLMAIGLLRVRAVTAALVLTCLALLALPDFSAQRTVEAKSDWVAIASNVEAVARPGDAVYFVQLRVGDRPRGVMAFYPEKFEDLDDVGLVRAAAENGTLYDLVDPIGSAIERVETGQRLVLIAPRWAEASENAIETLQEDGFEQVESVTSSFTTVTVWVGG